MVDVTLGEAIRLVRKGKRLTQRDLAQQTGFSLDSISRWERDERSPTANDLRMIAASLNTSVAFLMGESEEEAVVDGKASQSKTELMRMAERLFKKMASYSPDFVIQFRDLDKVIDQLEPEDIQALADAYASITGFATRGLEGRMRKKSRHGDL